MHSGSSMLVKLQLTQIAWYSRQNMVVSVVANVRKCSPLSSPYVLTLHSSRTDRSSATSVPLQKSLNGRNVTTYIVLYVNMSLKHWVPPCAQW